MELANKTEANFQAMGQPDFDQLELNTFVLKNRIAKKNIVLNTIMRST